MTTALHFTHLTPGSGWMHAVMEAMEDAVVGEMLDGTVWLWSQGAEKIFGYTHEEITNGAFAHWCPPAGCEEERAILAAIIRSEKVSSYEAQRFTKTGRLLNVSVSISPLREGDRLLGVVRIIRDVTAAKEREKEIARLTRLYAALSHVNQDIALMPTQATLFARVCKTLVEHGGFHLVWIGWNDPATHRLQPVARWGEEQDYLDGISIYTDDRPEGRGPSGRAFRENRPVICNDLLNEPPPLPWKAETQQRGLRASAVFPIRLGGAVVGTLNVYADETGFFQDKEIALLKEVAGDLSLGLDNIGRQESRQLAELKMRQERDFSEAIINSLPGVLYLYDQSGRFLRWNANFERVTGYGPDEIASKHPLDLFTGTDRNAVAARIEEVFERGTAEVEALLLTKDGRQLPYYFTGVLTDFGGRNCLVGVGIDISARKAAEEAMRLSEARYRTLFEQAPDGLLLSDSDSRYLDANASMCQMLGYRREELIGLSAMDILALHEFSHVEPAIEAIRKRRDHHREWTFRRKDGSLFPVEVIATLMPDGRMLGMVRDITARKEAEAALRELNETLEQKVASRTAQLQTALVRAEAADQIKSAFLATMSHELRTPLNSIIGFTGIVLQGLPGPINAEQAKQLGMVRGSARHLLELINDVLDLSKIEAGQLDVRPESFDLPAVIERVTASVRPLAEKKRLSLDVQLASGLGEMITDRRRLEQVLLNLLNNAIKFTEKGGVTLTVAALPAFRFQAGGAPAPFLAFRVSDTGIGIKDSDIEKLFQPFRQIDAGLTRVHEGTGLGLAICRRLADLMGGTVSVESEWGRGSEFTVHLPLNKLSPP